MKVRIRRPEKVSEELQRLSPEEMARIRREVAFDLYRRIIANIPVDTGRARGDWEVVVGEPGNGEPALKTDDIG